MHRSEVRATASKNSQAVIFEQQLDLAVELGLNVVIHERDAWDDTLAILRPYAGRLRAVFHCFGKSPAQRRRAALSGPSRFLHRHRHFQECRRRRSRPRGRFPADAFMVETDCPFLAPVPFRGKRCEPAHTRQVAEHIARLARRDRRRNRRADLRKRRSLFPLSR